MSRAGEGGARGGTKSKGGDCSPPHAMFYGLIPSAPTAGRAKFLAWRENLGLLADPLMQRLALSQFGNFVF
jgi:hypothetical protein